MVLNIRLCSYLNFYSSVIARLEQQHPTVFEHQLSLIKLHLISYYWFWVRGWRSGGPLLSQLHQITVSEDRL